MLSRRLGLCFSSGVNCMLSEFSAYQGPRLRGAQDSQQQTEPIARSRTSLNPAPDFYRAGRAGLRPYSMSTTTCNMYELRIARRKP